MGRVVREEMKMDYDDEEEEVHQHAPTLSKKEIIEANEVIEYFHVAMGKTKKKYKKMVIHAALTQIIHKIMIDDDIGKVEHGIKEETPEDKETPSYIR
jgi:hypothetical protein